MSLFNKFSILIGSIIMFYTIIFINSLLGLTQINLIYLIKTFKLNSKMIIFSYLLLFLLLIIIFGIIDIIYIKYFIKKNSIKFYLLISMFLTLSLFVILYILDKSVLNLSLNSIISFYTTISFVTIFNLYSLNYNYIIADKIKNNKTLPEPITSNYD